VIVFSAESTVPFARRADYLAWYDKAIQITQQQPGFQAATLLSALGTPSRHIGINRFDTLQSMENWLYGAAASFLQQNPIDGVATPNRPAEVSETVVFQRNQGNIGFLTLVDVTIDFRPENGPAFERRTQELIDLWQRHGKGVVVTGLVRSLNNNGRYTIAWGHLTREDVQATAATPEIARFMEKNHLSNYTSTAPVINQCQVVKAAVAQQASVR
jgi:hypothetical protein